MGKVRRFFRNLNCLSGDSESKDSKASASPEAPSKQLNATPPGSTTNGNSNRADQPGNGLSSGKTGVSLAAAENNVSKEIWINAYTKLQNDNRTRDLVRVYEEVLQQKWQEFESDEELFAGCEDVGQKIPRMCLVTERTLEAASKHSGAREGIIKAADFIDVLNSVVKPMLEANAVASMAWAGVCVLLPLFFKPVTASTEMANGLDYVRCRMEWYMALVKTLLDDCHTKDSQLRGELKHRIQELYVSILTYEMQCVRSNYHDNPIVRGLRAVVALDDWKSSLETLQTLESRVQGDMKLFASTETLDYLASIAASNKEIDNISRLLHEFVGNDTARDRQARQAAQSAITGQFKTTDYERQMKLNPERVPGTCEWFCGHAIFRNWLEGDSRFLLASADPGCGKSTLARHLIENVFPQHDASTNISYFFFKDTPEQKSLANGLSAIIHQLFYTDGSLASQLQDDINREGKDISALWTIFTKACIQSSRNIICVFDALDECEAVDRNHLIEKLNSFTASHDQNQPRAKILVTTRGYPQILNQFSFLSSGMIHLSGDGKTEKDQIQSEINLVLDFKLNELAARRGLKPEQTDSMRQSLRLKGEEQRTYLWLKLVFEVLHRTFPKSAKDWKKHIENPPDTVFKAYEALLNQVSEDDGERESVRVLLHLVVTAHRPLTLREMNVAINVREYLGGRDENSMGLLADSQFKSWLTDTCGFFVTVYDDRVFLIHQTAKEFLMGSQPDPARGSKAVVTNKGQPNWYGSVTGQKADAYMAESCIAYLSLGQFNDEAFYGRAQKYYNDHASCERIAVRGECGPWKCVIKDKGLGLPQQRASLFADFDFLEYAISWWIKHFDSCQTLNGAIIDIAEAIIPYYAQIFSVRHNKAPGWLLLTLMALREQAGPERCRCACNLRSGSEKFFVENYTLGRAAFWFDHPRLLQHALDQDSGNPAALCFQHCRVLIQGSDSYLCDDRRENSEEAIYWRGRPEAESHTSLLHTAASFGALNCARFVLERGSDVNEQDIRGRTPLIVVASRLPKLYPWQRAISLLDLLLDYGANTKNASSPKPWNSTLNRLLGLLEYEANERHSHILGYYGTSVESYVACDAIIRRIISAGVDSRTLVQAVEISSVGELYGWRSSRTSRTNSVPDDHEGDEIPSDSFDKRGDFQLDKAHQSGLNLEAVVSRRYNKSLLKLFLDHGADINATWEQKTALEIRLGQLYHSEWVQLDVAVFLHAGADTRINMDTGRSALDIVLRQGDVNSIGMLLDHDPVPEYINRPVDAVSLETRLHRASVHHGAAELLLRFGAQLEAQDRHGQTALHHSIRSGWGNMTTWRPDPTTTIREVIQLLHGRGADINARDHNGNTPLHKACYEELAPEPGRKLPDKPTKSIVELLIELGADCMAANGKGETPLHVACKHSSTDTVLFLLKSGGADIIIRDGDGQLPLQIALQARKFKSASWLIRYGADLSNVLRRDDVEAKDKSELSKTLLHFVCEWNMIDAAKVLLRHCADPNSRDTEGVTPFSAAVKEFTPDYTPLLELLLDAGADIESQTSGFHTPLISACRSQNSDAVKFLLGHGAKLTGHGGQPWTVLAWACKSSSPEIVEILLQYGAEIKLKEHSEGKALLHGLAKSWREEGGHKFTIHKLETPLEDRGDDEHEPEECKLPLSSHCKSCNWTVLLESYKKREDRACDIVRPLLDAGGWAMTRKVDEEQTPFEVDEGQTSSEVDEGQTLSESEEEYTESNGVYTEWEEEHYEIDEDYTESIEVYTESDEVLTLSRVDEGRTPTQLANGRHRAEISKTLSEADEGRTPFELAKKGRWMRLAEIFQAVPSFRRRTLPLKLRRHSFHCTSSKQGLHGNLEESPRMTTPIQFRTHGTVMDLARARGYKKVV